MVLLAAVEASSKLEEAIRSLVEHGSQLGFTIIKALIVFLVGRLVINLLNKLVRKILSKRDIDPSVKTFALELTKPPLPAGNTSFPPGVVYSTQPLSM